MGTSHCSDRSASPRTSHRKLEARLFNGATQLNFPKVWFLRFTDYKDWCVYKAEGGGLAVLGGAVGMR